MKSLFLLLLIAPQIPNSTHWRFHVDTVDSLGVFTCDGKYAQIYADKKLTLSRPNPFHPDSSNWEFYTNDDRITLVLNPNGWRSPNVLMSNCDDPKAEIF